MSTEVQIERLERSEITARKDQWQAFWQRHAPLPLSRHPAWLQVLDTSLQQQPYLLVATRAGETIGLLPLAFVKSKLFGRFLVSLPYLNSAGVMTDDAAVGTALVDRAVQLADRLDVRYLELRHEALIAHPAFNYELTSKLHMRLALPATKNELWERFSPKVRNQIRKGESHRLSMEWGTSPQQLQAFYDIFSRNMRDLGTPVYPRQLFAEIVANFPQAAEFCIVRQNERPLAAALLLHGQGITEVPSASSLREFKATNANMLMYWHLLQRAIARGQQTFDFGRSSADSNTYRFKKQWGAEPTPAVWQYYLRQGDVSSMRPESSRNRRLIRLWQHLPLWASRQLGPWVVRGIP
jgi:FemAB-related protein (PEP-CTERM system-associated)